MLYIYIYCYKYIYIFYIYLGHVVFLFGFYRMKKKKKNDKELETGNVKQRFNKFRALARMFETRLEIAMLRPACQAYAAHLAARF